MRRSLGLTVLILVAGTPTRSAAQQCPVSLVTDVRAATGPAPASDSAYAKIVLRAQSAAEARQWMSAATLWRDALETNALMPAHWNEYGHVLYQSGRYRDAVAAFERAIQLDGAGAAIGAWNVARSYARAGNGKQAYRWLAHAFEQGLRPRALVREEPAFQRYRDEPRFRALVDSIDGQRRGSVVRGHERVVDLDA